MGRVSTRIYGSTFKQKYESENIFKSLHAFWIVYKWSTEEQGCKGDLSLNDKRLSL